MKKSTAHIFYSFSGFFDKKHITFPTDNHENYMEGHHIIPVALNDSFEEDIALNENLEIDAKSSLIENKIIEFLLYGKTNKNDKTKKFEKVNKFCMNCFYALT